MLLGNDYLNTWLKKVGCLIVLLLSALFSSAQYSTIVGCSNDANNDVYYIPGPTGYPYANYVGPSRLYDPASTNCERFVSYTNLYTRCCINGNCSSSNRLYSFVNYNNCPIDDYVWGMILIAGVCSFFFLRNKMVVV